MELTCLIVDNFYSNPDSVRNFALSQPFDVKGNFPGSRTKPFFTDDVKEAIEYYIPWAGKIRCEDASYTGSFQITTAQDRTWIHSDINTTWAAVCYLTPDAPGSGGTGLFRYKSTNEFRGDNKYDGYDYTKWELFDKIGNRYNRLILYRGDLYHASLDYFGDNMQNGRLFQVFFFNTVNV
jgi:Family of unknown function (DUF6445)